MKKVILSCGFLFAMNASYANVYTIYQAPNANSNQIGKLDTKSTTHNYIPFYQGPNSWIKIGNRANGQIGWINTTQPQIQPKENNTTSSTLQTQQLIAINKERAALHKRLDILNQRYEALQKRATLPPQGISEKFMSESIRYNGGKTATITKYWTDQNGKIQTATEQLPANQLTLLHN